MTIPELHKAFLASTGVSTDTRAIKNGNIYFALKGDNFDGNKFAQQAIDNGATIAVIDDEQYHSTQTLLVDNVLSTLQQLSSYHRDQLTIPVIGLTGSNGKTTTKELIAAALAPKYNVAFTKGNLNNHIGVPLTLLSIKPEHEIAVVEMGANHQKEIEFLCSLSKPDFGYITNFGKAHLEGFGGIEGVIKGKTELYDFLRDNNKTVFINANDDIQLEKSVGIKTITFGQNEGVNIWIHQKENSGSELDVDYKDLSIHSNLTGTYNFPNLSAAIAIAEHFEVPPHLIKQGLENYFPTNNRSQVTKTDNNTLIVDTYNANPSSMEAALNNMNAYSAEHKWVILGDMFELGEYEKEEHQRITDLALAQNFEKVILVGKAFVAANASEALQFDTTTELLTWLEQNPIKGKTILLKGSRGMAIERAIPHL